MQALLKLSLASAACLSTCTPAATQALVPGGDPDIVYECFVNGQPSDQCKFSCGSELNQSPQGQRVEWANVSRVEIYHKGSVGRVDTRSFVVVKFKTLIGTDIASLYIAPPIYCETGIVSVGGNGMKFEMRITKFNFNKGG